MGVIAAHLRQRAGVRGIAAAAILLVALAAAVATPQLLGSTVAHAFHALGRADPRWLWLAGGGFAVTLVGAAGSWRCVIRLCGGRTSLTDACARFGAGSLANTFVPARAGDAVRIALFSRLLPGERKLLTTGGAFAALGAARAIVVGALVVAGGLVGAIPLWPLLAAAGLVAAAALVAVRARRSTLHLLEAFRALGEHPAAAFRLIGWLVLSTLGRLAAATAIGAALGIHQPLAAALVILPALDVAGLLPLTPGNVGITSGAVALAFQEHGVSFTQGLAAGIAFHAVETAVGVMFGIASLVWLAPYPSAAARRLALAAGAASWLLAVAGAFGLTVVAPLV